MEKKLTKSEFLSISLLLFAMFFGAGNLIFPPMLGNQSGTSMVSAFIGFIVTAIIFPVLGILAVSKANGIQNLGNRVGPIFAVVYPAIIFLAIGPGIAIPRNGSLAFEMSVAPYLGENTSITIAQLIYTALFFVASYYLCLQPSKLVDRIGKILTPVLLALLIVFFLGAVITLPVEIASPTAAYEQAFMTGFIEGYNTMDTIAALNFGLVVTFTIKNFQIKDQKSIIKYASGSGVIAGLLLAIVYGMLAYVGMISSAGNQDVLNGGRILFNITNTVFGSYGAIVLILIFTLACMSTVVGLITSVSEYFATLTNDKITYRQWIIIYTVLSFIFANFGLNTILQFSIPILIAIYPPAIMLIVLALLHELFDFKKATYQWTIYVTLSIAIIAALRSANIIIPGLSQFSAWLPFYSNGLEWIVPSIATMIIVTGITKLKPKTVK